jgi:hypothetical protein
MSPDQQRLFTEMGHRGEQVDAPGWGVGLSLATRLAERFGWTLRFISPAQGGLQVSWIFTAEKNTD